ncbi:hypothetical protein B0H13DRAFT_501305 [Mycena leptocephala]|nr:hypothetical protein B0H13DRAFT_501305 [Mycena leptocephala]
MSLVQTVDPVDTPRSESSNDFFERSSQRTFTDTSTVWGPGTVSGRALLALGEVAIRGIEALVIRRKILAIRQRARNHLTSSMCNDLVELCRPAMYSLRIAKQAIRLTLTEICAGPESSMCMFVVFLCKWPRQEARLILLELVRSSSEVKHPPGWKPERLYDFLIAIIQVKAGWRSFVAEASALLDNTVPRAPIIAHPIHFLVAEVVAGLPESPLSSLQSTYSAHMRFRTWISLQACGLSMRERILEIARIFQNPENASVAQIVDAIADFAFFLGSQSRSHFDLDVQSSASLCFQSLTAAQWQRVLQPLELPVNAFNAELAWEEDTIDSMHALVFLRRAFCLFGNTGVPQILTHTATSMMDDRGSDYGWIHQCALTICKLSGDEVQEMLNTLLSNVLPSIRGTVEDHSLALKLLCDFLATICQITGDSFSRDVAATLLSWRLAINHPVITMVSTTSPLSKIQAEMCLDHNTPRFDIWTALQKNGFRLELRMAHIEHILSQQPKVSDHRTFDAIADASIFTRWMFSTPNYGPQRSTVYCNIV